MKILDYEKGKSIAIKKTFVLIFRRKEKRT
jgi:hypothetical protein